MDAVERARVGENVFPARRTTGWRREKRVNALTKPLVCCAGRRFSGREVAGVEPAVAIESVLPTCPFQELNQPMRRTVPGTPDRLLAWFKGKVESSSSTEGSAASSVAETR